MVSVPKLWPESTVVCIASGPSLTQDDCDFVRGKARVIAINDGVRLAPWADVLYSSDRVWFPTFFRRGGSFEGLRFGLKPSKDPADVPPGFKRCPSIAVLCNTGVEGLERDPTGLREGRNSGYAAINLAVHLGARRIVLLGYNMSAIGGKRHFFGDVGGMSPYTQFRQKFETIVQPLRELGVNVVNCTPETRLTCFPVKLLRDVFPASVEVAA